LPQLPEGRNYRGPSRFQGSEEVRKPSSYSEAHHSCPDAIMEKCTLELPKGCNMRLVITGTAKICIAQSQGCISRA